MSSARRAAEIAAVLTKHGLGWVVDATAHHDHEAGPVHLRMALEELGPTFIKLGQILSTRADLVPPDYEHELARLQDGAPPVAWSDLEPELRRGLTRPASTLFASIDPIPLASASIGQVHAATLADGRDVVVKLRRPGIRPRVEEDLRLIQQLAHVAAKRSTLADRYDPIGLATEFTVNLRAELDYAREGRNADRIRDEIAGEHNVHVPAIEWAASGDGILTMERLYGSKIDDIVALTALGIDCTQVANDFADLFLGMVFKRGIYHADPHPGNVLVESDGTLALLDYGMVGSVSDDLRQGLGLVVLALVANNATALVDALARMGVADDEADRASLTADLASFLVRYAGVPLGELQFGDVINDLMSVVRHHHLRMPHQLALLFKTVIMCEGVARTLDPDFHLGPRLVPLATAIGGT